MYGEYSLLYDKWCECYDVNNEEMSILKDNLFFKNKTILDVGCGTGRLTIRLAEEAKEVYGIDIDDYSISVLEDKIVKKKIKNIKACCKDILMVNFPNKKFDIIVFSWSLYSLPKDNYAELFEKIYSWLNDDGKLLILQPQSGEFEEVMRSIFVENQEHEEYDECLKLLGELSKRYFILDREFLIHQYFIFGDLSFGVEAIKMFAITEGEYSGKMETIPDEPIICSLKKYQVADKFVLDDYVKGFVFSKADSARQ